ncbi:MAG: ATP-binding cassette domain-containing protein, partial [Anaerolineales bacterium]|nr:ATP-binding cassette domain-containing protein [Anaerolineales bacterium]
MIADTPAKTGAIGPALVVRNVSLTFPDGEQGLHVLSDISFSVAAEEFVCILGPSGSGKSTLLRILAGLLTPSQGEISYPDLPNGDSGQPIGFVFQKANLMP